MNGFLQHYGLIILASVIVLTFIVFASIFGSTISNNVETVLANFFNKTTVEEEVCEHSETKTVGSNSNYSGDVVCKDCGKVQEKGEYLGEYDVIIYTDNFIDYNAVVKYSLDGENYKTVNNNAGTVTIPDINTIWFDIEWSANDSMAFYTQDMYLTDSHISSFIELDDTLTLELVHKTATFKIASINGTVIDTFTFEVGMTWEEFINSTYNSVSSATGRHFDIHRYANYDTPGYAMASTGAWQNVHDNPNSSSPEKLSEKIIAGNTYIVAADGDLTSGGHQGGSID